MFSYFHHMIKQLNDNKCLILEACSVPGLRDRHESGWLDFLEVTVPVLCHPAILVDFCGFQKDTKLARV